MTKYRRTKNILEAYEPEAEGWYTFATLHEPSGARDTDELLARAEAHEPPTLHTRSDQQRCPVVYKGERCIYVEDHNVLHLTGKNGYW